jgi:hypothetical protein
MAGLDLSMLSRKPAAGGGKAPAAEPPVAEPTKDAASTGRHNNNTSSTDDFGAPPPEYEDVFDDYGFGSYAEYDDMTAVSGSSMMSVLGTNNSNNNHHHGTKETVRVTHNKKQLQTSDACLIPSSLSHLSSFRNPRLANRRTKPQLRQRVLQMVAWVSDCSDVAVRLSTAITPTTTVLLSQWIHLFHLLPT